MKFLLEILHIVWYFIRILSYFLFLFCLFVYISTRHAITEILLKVELSTIKQALAKPYFRNSHLWILMVELTKSEILFSHRNNLVRISFASQPYRNTYFWNGLTSRWTFCNKWEGFELGLWCLTPLSTLFSAISWRSGLLAEETGVSSENHQPASSHWQNVSHNVARGTSRLSWNRTHNVNGDRHCLYM